MNLEEYLTYLELPEQVHRTAAKAFGVRAIDKQGRVIEKKNKPEYEQQSTGAGKRRKRFRVDEKDPVLGPKQKNNMFDDIADKHDYHKFQELSRTAMRFPIGSLWVDRDGDFQLVQRTEIKQRYVRIKTLWGNPSRGTDVMHQFYVDVDMMVQRASLDQAKEFLAWTSLPSFIVDPEHYRYAFETFREKILEQVRQGTY